MSEPMRAALQFLAKSPTNATAPDPFRTAEGLREPIFYGAESAYSFQYRDLSARKYCRDDDWLKNNKGFTADEAAIVASALGFTLDKNALTALNSLHEMPSEKSNILEGFEFNCVEIAKLTKLPLKTVTAVINAFTFPDNANQTFTALHEFNASNAYPIIKGASDKYILFQYVSLTEALYETPFYWMAADKVYKSTAMEHRGQFTEEFTAERLEHVFGTKRVLRNVVLWKTRAKKERVGEIDALVVFADRAIVIQAKSKRLTLEARKGNDLQLQRDFKSAVQDACDQAVSCSALLLSGSLTATDIYGRDISLPQQIKQAHPVCVVSDHYPALSFQANQFLQIAARNRIAFPLVCDIFFVDVVSEFLDTPLRLLSYLELRAKAADSVLLSHEITALGFHLKQNLWLGTYDRIYLGDDIATDLNIAMAARRDGVSGEKTPPGILTALRGTTVGRLISDIERESEPAAVAVGLELLRLDSEGANNLSLAVDKIIALAKNDGNPHDVTLASDPPGPGITVHCNSLPATEATARLGTYCAMRKYKQGAAAWYGLILEPQNGMIRFGLALDYPWKQDNRMDEVTANMMEHASIKDLPKLLRGLRRDKIGRNEPCHCGSGLKYKRCHLSKDRSR